MRIPPTSPTNLAERHVQLSEFVDVSVHSMTDTQMATIIDPSMHAQRLERMMRDAEIPTVRTPPPPVEDTSRCTCVYKRTCDAISLACGAAAIPALGLAAFGPVWLVAPACLLAVSAACFLLRGDPTPAMEQEYEMRRVSAQVHDSQGV